MAPRLRKVLITIITITMISLLAAIIIAAFNFKTFGPNIFAKRIEPTREESIVNKTQMRKVMWKFMVDHLLGRGNLRPKKGEIPVIKTDLKNLPADGDLLVWFGHSSFMLRLSGQIILVDPVFIEASPIFFVNRPFIGTDYYKPLMMPEHIDYIVISHDHYDHLDYKTVKQLRSRVGKVLCPLGIGADFLYWGYTREQIIELDYNEAVTMSPELTFTCLPTQHFSGRGLFDRMKTNRASWLINNIFYSGDGGYSDRFKEYGKRYDIDLAILENGQYNEAWRTMHTMPNDLTKEVTDLHPKRFMTVHHSKYALAMHDWQEPRRNEQLSALQTGIPLIITHIGKIVRL